MNNSGNIEKCRKILKHIEIVEKHSKVFKNNKKIDERRMGNNFVEIQ